MSRGDYTPCVIQLNTMKVVEDLSEVNFSTWIKIIFNYFTRKTVELEQTWFVCCACLLYGSSYKLSLGGSISLYPDRISPVQLKRSLGWCAMKTFTENNPCISNQFIRLVSGITFEA